MGGELDRVRAQIELAVRANGFADRRLSSIRCVWSTRGVGVEQRPSMWRAGVEGAGLAIMAAMSADAVVRRGTPADALAAAEIWLRSRKAAMPAIPAPVHTDDDVRHHFRTIVVTERELWVAVDDISADVTGLLVLADADVDQLYVDPGWWRCGIGSQLLEQAKRLRPNGLWLWTFQTNTGARRFYERHGFVAVAFTEGDNEEGEPDVRYHWSP